MSAGDWKKVGETAPLTDCALAVVIEVRVDEAEDMRAALTAVKADAAKMAAGTESGTWEAQWCNSAARIRIDRGAS